MKGSGTCRFPSGSTAFAVGVLGCIVVVAGLLGSAPAVAGVSGAACIEQDPNTGTINCTANDVRIGMLEVVGNSVTCDPTPIQCVGGGNAGELCTVDADCPDPFPGACIPEQVTVTLKATILSGPERYDIGLWLNQTGGSAQDDPDGTCYRDILTPLGAFPTDTTLDCDSVSGPYANGDNDSCGDIPKTSGECTNTVVAGNDLITEYTFTAAIACIDSNDDGTADAGACTSWSQRPDEIICNEVLDAIPGSPAKCECNPIEIVGLFSGCKTDAECDDGNVCTVDTCVIEGNVGTCVYTNNNSLPQCSDGSCIPEQCDDDLCTINSCNDDGSCAAPIPVTCGPGDQCNDDVCDPATGMCAFVPKADSTPCEDGDFCTSETGTPQTPDHCFSGVCTGVPVDCSAEDDQCNVGVCNDATGACEADPIADSTPCEDGNVCTSETGMAQTPDHCFGGVCTGVPVDCSGEDDQCNVGVCNDATGACEADPIADSTPCEDGNVCTSETGMAQTPDHCFGGVCTGVPVDCSGEDDQCNVGVCNDATGACEADPIADSTPCEDGNVCTSETGMAQTPDHCFGGVCTGVPVDCSGEDDQCNVGVCNDATGACEADPIADSTPCEDGNVCTSETGMAQTPDHCFGGVCTGVPVDCSGEDDQCNVGVCNDATGACEADPIADSTPCEDGNVCTSETGMAQTPDHCFGGVCTGVPVDCSGEDDQCNVGVCNDATGACEADPIADSTPCEDGNVCTSETGMAQTPDHCFGGVCTGVPVDCSGEDDQCNVGVCNDATGACEADPIADSTPCEDGNVCTSETGMAQTPDHCFGGVCTGVPVDCSGEDDQCNVGVCNDATGACEADPIADSTPCEDGNVCTSETGMAQTPDHCFGGVCTGVPVDCSGEDDQCNVGVCNDATGACEADPIADSTPCEDGNVCTSETGMAQTPDHCFGGVCTGVPVDCSALDDECNDGVCNATSGACEADPLPESTPCDDLFFCTSFGGEPGDLDHCDGLGSCVGDPVDCDDGNPCTNDECNEGNDQCDNIPDGTCAESCTDNGKPKPPKELVFTYENTFGDPAWDDVCITVDHPNETQSLLFEAMVSDGGTFTVVRPGPKNRKLNPSLDLKICQSDGSACTDTCDVFSIHTSCSQPLGIGQRFGTGGDGVLQPQDPADANQDGELILQGQLE